MYIIDEGQARILRILEKTRVLTVEQAYRITKAVIKKASNASTLRSPRQLRYVQKLRFLSDDVVALSSSESISIDHDMLAAIDVMLDISDCTPLDVGGESAPFKLRFLTDDGERIGNYGVILVPIGHEDIVNFQLEEVNTSGQKLIFLLSDLAQRDKIKTSQPHYFAVKDGDKYRYYAEN